MDDKPDAALLEGRRVQPDACFVFRINGRDDGVQPARARRFNQWRHEQLADPLSAMPGVHVHRVFDGELITLAIVVAAQ